MRHFASALRRARQSYAQRRHCLLEALKPCLGPSAHISGAEQGLHLCLRLPATLDDRALAQKVIAAGLRWRAVHLSDLISCRMYANGKAALEGFTKNYFAVFDFAVLPYIFVYLYLLLLAWQRPWMPEYISALPIAGVDGTARRRLRDSAANGRAHIKTGSLNGVNSLAGTVVTADGRMLVFAIMQEGPVGTTDARAALDRFGAALATCGCR